jgi:hypothetical protein
MAPPFVAGRNEPRLGRVGRRVKPLPPDVACGATLGRAKEVLQRDMDERASAVREELVAVPELAADLHPPAAIVLELGGDRQRSVDVNRLEEADREACRHRRESVPGREQPAGLVERGADEAPVDEARCRLMLVVKGEGCLVLPDSLLGRVGEVDPRRIVTAPPAGGVVMRRDSIQRIPPRSKWALKKFSEPDVAIEADAEISSARVAAATICAKR